MTENEAPVVLVDDADHVRLITLNRPHKLNAFDQALFTAFGDALADAAADDDVRVVVVTGAGRAFSAGADMTAMGRAKTTSSELTEAYYDNPFVTLQKIAEAFPKPLVAAVNGVGVGLGFNFLGYCDVVYIAEGARLRTPFTALGVVPEASSSYLFPLRMGWQRAAKALLAGDWFDATAAVEAGLAIEVCPDGAVVATAREFATRLAQAPLASLVATKQLMLDGHLAQVRRARGLETDGLARLVGGADNAAAVSAFQGARSGR